jgi:coronin-1B/1C/6
LKEKLSQKDVKIRVLEIELDKLRTELSELTLAKKNEELPHSENALVE